MKWSEIDYKKSFQRDDYPPIEYLVSLQRADEAQTLALTKLLDNNASETEVDAFLKLHPEMLAYVMNFTQFGHHATYVMPQMNIRTSGMQQKGLKPDYLVGGKNSNGFEWYVVELKGVSDKVFVKKDKDIHLSAIANKGICQLLRYIDYCSEQQAFMRDQQKLVNFREPKGFLIIGRSSEFDDVELQKMKKAFNTTFSGRIEIRTYDALLNAHGD